MHGTKPIESVEYLTREQWYLGGMMRSLHRYASDAAVLIIVLHIVKEFAFDRYRSQRWFTWRTGTLFHRAALDDRQLFLLLMLTSLHCSLDDVSAT